jgi:hypothetical protein
MIRSKLFTAALLLLAATMAVAAVDDNSKTGTAKAGERIDWQVVASGGGAGVSANYGLTGTVGQTAAGLGVSTSYRMYHGYWQDFGGTSCCTLAGDANNDGKIHVGDAVYIVTYVFRSGPAPVCMEAADANADDRVDIGDAVYLITYVFRWGPAPICP